MTYSTMDCVYQLQEILMKELTEGGQNGALGPNALLHVDLEPCQELGHAPHQNLLDLVVLVREKTLKIGNVKKRHVRVSFTS